MKFANLMVFVIGILFYEKAYACINSDCKPCSDGFLPTSKCCDSNESNCIVLSNKIEDCGKDAWYEYPVSLLFNSFSRMECCKNLTENNCLSVPNTKDYCGEGVFKEYPYSPVKKCCKDSIGNDCVIIRSKGRCGKYQLEKYPLQIHRCCNSDLSKCTEIRDCPKCI